MKNRKDARSKIEQIFENPNQYFIIHYSCESFYNNKSITSPRITSIAIKSLESNQISSFSIHLTAERRGIAFNLINQNFNILEQEMLKDYYDFVKAYGHAKWVHWNMRDTNYGFKAIEHRFQVLGGIPVIISDHDKIDLSPLIHIIYGDNYSDHPRLESLIRMNGITDKDFLNGEEESQAFMQGNYFDLHRSTLRKVDVLHTIGIKAASGTLITKKWAYKSELMNILVLLQKIQQHWITTLVLFIAAFLGFFTNIKSLFF